MLHMRRQCKLCKKIHDYEEMVYNLNNNDGEFRELGGECDVFVSTVFISGPYCWPCWDKL